MSYFTGVDRALIRLGHSLIISRVHPTGSIEKRARQLKETILRQLDVMGADAARGAPAGDKTGPPTRIAIIAHSLGGLDARYMISKLGMAERVETLITVTTPHHGSPYADWCVRHLGQRLGGFKLMNFLGIDVEGIRDLTTERCARFNECVENAPGVKYFSVSCARPWNQITPLLMPSHKVVFDVEGDNDGLVSVRSAHWGEHLETWPADHLHSINKRFVLEGKHGTGSITPYYLRLVERVVGST
ncbi:MAG TPA: hypothetical protein VIL86_16065, partial [Tepidisphaeraceae bacterium]